MLAVKVLASTLEDWFGRPARQIRDADVERFLALHRAAKKMTNGR